MGDTNFTTDDRSILQQYGRDIATIKAVLVGMDGSRGLCSQVNELAEKLEGLPCGMHTKLIADIDITVKKVQTNIDKKQEKSADRAFSIWQALGLLIVSNIAVLAMSLLLARLGLR